MCVSVIRAGALVGKRASMASAGLLAGCAVIKAAKRWPAHHRAAALLRRHSPHRLQACGV